MLTSCFLIIGSELIIDWVKHSFIIKFNQIQPALYGSFVNILCLDISQVSYSHLTCHTPLMLQVPLILQALLIS